MANTNEIKVKVTESDRFETSEYNWTLADLSSWDLSEDETYRILNGETVKLISPNGSRKIYVTKK